jgi:hypothetical protein
MKTFGSVIEEVLSNTRGFTAASDQVTSLAAAMTDSETSGRVDDLAVISAGIIEVGDELMWVKSIDFPSGSFTLLPKGRGWEGTTASAHSTGDTVTVRPAYPRARVKAAINEAILGLWPVIFPVKTTEFTFDNTIKTAWEIPSDAEQILDVRYRDYLGNWQRVRAWEVERSSNTTDFASGLSLRITQNLPVGQTVQVVYGSIPTTLTDEADPFSDTGFEDRIADLVTLSTMARLIPMLDVHRLQVTHVAADELDQPRPLGSADALAKSFRSQYVARLQEEQKVLRARYPARIHLTR